MSATILVRTKLTPDQWAAFRKWAIDRGEPVSQLAADAMMKALPKQYVKGDKGK